ncbi:unnamed protein product [Porites lobata]|uniref:Uncharacterized protein n=1 Tax=Porites lobata TaxID=104759 RepID=A0ABN8SH62_9CNID|nr:unnamed protein product [Porites lobata]
MASSVVESVESLSEIHQLFRDISLKFSPAESEDVVQSVKRIYGEQFKSLGKQDLMSCLGRSYEFGYVTDTKLTLIKEFIATKSSNENDINQRIEDFETFRPPQSELEKILGERSDEITKIMEILENRQKPIVNLYGVGKSTVAKEICGKWGGQTYVVDLKEAENMRAVCLNIMTTLGLPVFFDTEHIILDSPENGFSADHSILLVLDNFEDSTKGKQKKVKDLHVNLEPHLLDFLGELSRYESKAVTVHLLLTSRTQLRDSKVTNYELQFLKNSLLEEIFLSDVDAQQKKRLLEICKGNPLLLVGTAAILKQKRKSPSDLIDVIEKSSQGEAEIPVKSKGEEDMEEKPFNSEEEGIDKEQSSLIREMFYTLPSDILRVSAVSVSLFHGPFTASTAAKILDVSTSEVVAQLEGLVTNGIIQVAEKDAKQLMYVIHSLLRKYAESIKNDDMFCDSYTEAKGRFYEHFMSKMNQIAGLMKTNNIKAVNEFQRDRPNFEFAIDISLLPEYFSVPGGYHEITLIVFLFNAVLAEKKMINVFHSWAEMCPNDGKLGMQNFFKLS